MWFAVIPSACLPLSHATHLNLHSRWVPASYILHNKAQQYLCDENSNAKISITDKKKINTNNAPDSPHPLHSQPLEWPESLNRRRDHYVAGHTVARASWSPAVLPAGENSHQSSP